MAPNTDQRSLDQKLSDLRKAHAAGQVVGLRDFGIAYRLDIDVLLTKQPDTFNLFLIALDSLQNEEPSTNIMGYFQIAGIHGYPSTLWANIPGRKPGSVFDPGYCNHGSETFPTWHRPYLAMIEQALFIKMIDVANKYTDAKMRTNFVNAAFNFRLPFFDYFRPRAGPGKFTFPGVISGNSTAYDYDYSVPAIFTAPEVTIRNYPDGALRQISNPLHHYRFQSSTSKVATGQLTSKEWDSISTNTVLMPRDRTVRHPTSTKPGDNPDRLNSVMNELRMDSNRIAVTMVTSSLYRDYAVFSTNRAGVKTIDGPFSNSTASKIAFGASGSLEAIHGIYHVLMGGWGQSSDSGHMSQVPCAAFDPIFWAHHGNIERLFSIWQAVHADESDTNWFDNPKQAKASLLPFLKPAGIGNPNDQFWTSNASDNCEWFGYTYTDLDKSSISVADRFRNLYAWSTPRTPNAPKQSPPDNMKPLNKEVSASEFFKPPNAPRTRLLALRSVETLAPPLETHIQSVQAPMSAKDDVGWDWFVDDRVERLALNNSFTISYFVLRSPQDNLGNNTDVVLDPALIGLTHIFTSPIEACPNCAEQATEKVLVRNTVPFTSQLLDYVSIGQLNSMEPDDVLKFLKGRLRWRVVKADGQSIDPRTIPSLAISVSAKRTVLDEHMLPTGQVEYHEYPELVRDIIAGSSAEAGHLG